MSPEFNVVAIAILVGLIGIWNLDLIATILNLRALGTDLPDEFRTVYDEETYARSQEYARANSCFGVLTSAVSLTAFLVFWFLGGFGWLHGWVCSLGLGPITSGLVFIPALLVANYLLHLPFSIYDTFVLEERFGFNKTSPRTFVIDQIKTGFLSALIGLPILATLLLIFEHVDQAWLWAWVAFTAFMLILTYLAPTFIMPLFNKFEPMSEGPLRDAIQKMADDCAFPLTEISVMDGSRRSSKSNAFFVGLGKNKKIALYDTLIEGQSQDELVAVLAHEIGHYKRKHIIQRLVLSIVQFGVLFFLLGLIIDEESAFAGLLFPAFGISPADITPSVGLVLFMILFGPVSRLLGVALNAWSRQHEFEADAFAAEAQGSPRPLIRALKKLSADNLSHLSPHPLRVILDYSHPPVLRRIEALRKGAEEAADC